MLQAPESVAVFIIKLESLHYIYFVEKRILDDMHRKEVSARWFPNSDSIFPQLIFMKEKTGCHYLILKMTQRGLCCLSRSFNMCRIRPSFWCNLMANSNRAGALRGWLKTTGWDDMTHKALLPHDRFFFSNSRKPLEEVLYASQLPLPESVSNFLPLLLDWKCNCHFQYASQLLMTKLLLSTGWLI